jgi:AcrR family transcriptional regulator
MKITSRKLEIITVASTLFKEKGYSAVTMRDIAKAMGIKAASLYNHIKNKEEILTFIIISLAEEFIEGINKIQSSKENSQEKLKKIITLHIDITSQNTNGMASLNNDWMHLKKELEYYKKLRVDY